MKFRILDCYAISNFGSFTLPEVKQGIADGLTVDQAKQQLKLPDKYKSFAFQKFAVPNVEDMYKELKGIK